MTYTAVYHQGVALLEEAQILEAKLDARLLLENICHTNYNDLLVHGERQVTEEEQAQYFAWIQKRCARVPLQQLVGEQEFMGLSFLVNENVLIPRQDTEIVVEAVQKDLEAGMRILDMCTGSGCILISLLYDQPHAFGVGVDLSGDALCVARSNAKRLLGSQADDRSRICFVQSDLFEALQEELSRDGVLTKFDRIVSNPPYIRTAECERLMPEVRDHEPRMALDGREDGLFFYRKIVEEAPAYLVDGGRLYFEIGWDQAADVVQLLREKGYEEICVEKDYAGLDRVVHGRYRQKC